MQSAERRMANRLARFRSLSIREKVLFLRIAATSRLRLRRMKRDAIPGLGQAWAGSGAPVTGETPATAQRLGWLVNAAVGVGAGPDNCLLRCATLSRLLQRRDIAHRICLGAKAHEPFRLAHAWVEVNGEPVNDTPENIAAYARFESATQGSNA